MLITTPEELQQYLPSSVYDAAESLVSLTERAERRHLVPVLGDKLYNYLSAIYAANGYSIVFNPSDGGGSPLSPSTTPDDPTGSDAPTPSDASVPDSSLSGQTPSDTSGSTTSVPDSSLSGQSSVARLLSLCQSAVAYFTVADNADILSLSFNMGNGLAQVNTDGYTAASEESLKRYISTAWHQARQDVDDICRLLEGIATTLPSPSSPTGSTPSDTSGSTPSVPDSLLSGQSPSSPSGSPSVPDSLLSGQTPSDGGVSTPTPSPEATLVDLWRSSEWFYLQGDVLLATCSEAKRYILASEQPFSYLEYVKLLGELRTRQEANIAPELGDELLNAIVRTQYQSGIFTSAPTNSVGGSDTTSSDTSPSTVPAPSPSSPTVPAGYPAGQPSDGGVPTPSPVPVPQVLHLLRLSLMSFVRWSRTDKPKYENDAKMFLFRAVELIKKHQDAFMPYVASSPFYVAPPPSDDEDADVDATHHHCHRRKQSDQRLYFGKSDDGIFNPFGV